MSIIWKSDHELLEMMKKELFSAVIGDVMDQLGLLNQFLPPAIQPLRDDMVVVGRAMPVLVLDTDHSDAAKFVDHPYGKLFEALDDLKTNEVYICSGAAPLYALWGELLSIRATKLGAAGAVINGYSRDTPGILDLDFPTFSYGRFAQDQAFRGTAVDFRIPIQIGQVTVNPGDIVFGDLDGVCVIPRQQEALIVEEALNKVRGEELVRKALEDGMSASEAFKTYGIM